MTMDLDTVFLKKRVISDELLDILLYKMENGLYSHGIISTKDGPKRVDSVRKCGIHDINVLEFPDLNNSIIELSHEFMPEVSNETHFTKELQILKYEVGGKFNKHNDTKDYNKKPRLLTSVTLLDRSDDLVGGDLLVWPDRKGEPVTIDFKPFETVVFRAKTFHQCTEVMQGTRHVLISWVHEMGHEISKGFFKRKALQMD